MSQVVFFIFFPRVHHDEFKKLCQDFNTRDERDKLQAKSTERVNLAKDRLTQYIKDTPTDSKIDYRTECDDVTNPYIVVTAKNENDVLTVLTEANVFDLIDSVYEQEKVPKYEINNP
jgi:hypothetical protein